MSLDSLRATMFRHLGYVMCLENVVGVGLGKREVHGTATNELVVTVLVKKKMAARQLSASQLVPRSLGRDCKTDVIEVGELRLYSLPPAPNRTGRIRPVPAGVSISHFLVSAGTLGCVVRDRAAGTPLLLSNNHVLANATNGRDGRAAVGDPIVQPGTYDGGRVPGDTIAYLDRYEPLHRSSYSMTCPFARTAERLGNAILACLTKSYELRLFRRGNVNYVDAAAARPVSPALVIPEIIGIAKPVGLGKVEPGQAVIKSGRTSGVTAGRVRVVEATVRVSLPDGESATFADQIITTAMAEPGDSGSVGLTEDLKAFGLLCAGSRSATMYSRLDLVLDALNCDLIT